MTSSHRSITRHALASVILLALGASAHAQTAQNSGATLDLRIRHEQVDDAAFARDAQASTVRIRLGYRWVFAPGWQAYVEGAHVQALFGAHYNSTANGKTRYPTVVDPQSSQLNQAFVAYANADFAATLGRQRIVLDNQRFFGNSGWRQNEQTFDAFSTRYSLGEDAPIIRYVFLDRVQRINGHDNPDRLLREWNLNGHLLNASQALPLGTLSGYGYWVRNNDMPNLSTRTLGARWTAAQPLGDLKLGWTLEYARQSDWRGNPQSLSAGYHLVEPSLSWQGVTFKAGWEVLGGNGQYGFATPYATLHAFNGWADRFLTTPRNGLDDRYLGADGKLGKASWAMAWHRYRADHGGQAYGREMDISLTYPLRPNLGVLLKYADYRADGFSSDARKLWASVEYRY